MPQTWDEKGNVIQSKPSIPPPLAKPAPAMPPPSVPTTKQKQTWDEKGNVIQAPPAGLKPATMGPGLTALDKAKEFFTGGASVPAKPLTELEKQKPFSSGVVSGSMLDPEKISKQKTTMGQVGEVGKQMISGSLNMGLDILTRKEGLTKPIDAIVAGQADAYRKVRDGLKSGNHDMLMNGLGEAVGNLSTLLGGAKTDEGIGVKSTLRDASFAAKDLTAKRAIVSAASHGALDALKDEHSSAIDTAVKAERQRIGGNVASINTTDLAKDPQGYVPQKLALATLDQAVADKKANVLLDKRMLPKVAQVRGLLEGHAQNLTFNDLKQVRSIVGDALGKATGVERAILGDYYSSLTKNLTVRSNYLGKLSEWNDYNEGAEKLAGHEKNLIPELQNSKTGLEYIKKIASEQNGPRLDTLEKDLHLPDGFFEKAVKDYKSRTKFAQMSEGDSLVAKTANRLIALKQHPIAAGLGGAAGVTAGRAIGTALGSPMAGSFIGLTLGAAFAHDLMSKYDAAREIREIGGPSGVMGVRVTPNQTPPSSSTPPSGAMTPPQAGPGGGGNSPSPTLPQASPSGPSPSVSPIDTSKISPALAKLLPESVKQAEAKPSAASLPSKEALEDAFRAKGMRGVEAHNLAIETLDNITGRNTVPEAIRKQSQERIDRIMGPEQRATPRVAPSESVTEPKVTKAPPEARGRTESARKGMTKDTPEARRAKAAERIASKRSEASRTNIKGTLEDQARQVVGKMDFQGKSNIELEEGLRDLFGENGNRFMKEFKSLARQKKWSEDVYRGYLEETLIKRAEESAKKPAIPGLNSEVVKPEPTKVESKPEPAKVEPKVESKVEPKPDTTTKREAKTEARRYRSGVIIKKGKQYTVRIAGKERGVVDNFADAQIIIDRYHSGYSGPKN